MNKLVIFHGSGGTSEDHWFPSLHKYFAEHGWQVTAPDFPNSGTPNLDEWLEAAQSLDLDEETVLVAHSLGCPFVMSLLERSTAKVKKAVLVAGLYDESRFPDLDFLQAEYDWSKIKTNCDEFVFVHSTNDPWNCDEQEADLAFDKLGGTKIIMEGQGHFGSDSHNQVYLDFPLVADLVKS